MTKRKHQVTFVSPGTFFSETTTRAIDEWDPAKAVKIAESITERYGARPYGFYFTTNLVAEDVDDGEGGKMRVQPKEVARSPMHYLGGEVLTYEQVVEQDVPNEEILRSNMRSNGIAVVLRNCNSYKTTVEFKHADVVVNPQTGEVVDRGNAPAWCDYRREFAKILKAAEL